MLRLIYTLLLLTISSIGICQVGNGILFMTDAEYQFPGTTVDSTSTFEFQVVNDLGAPQTIFFSALDAPFSLLDNSPLEIPANDTASVTLLFQPSEVGEFSGSLEAVGSVFGSASFDFTGEGTQVIIDWSAEILNFDTTAINSSSYKDIEFYNNGNGAAQFEIVNSSTGVFDANFIVLDTIYTSAPVPCEYSNSQPYYTFYLNVDLGDSPNDTYWYIHDEDQLNYNGGSYGQVADNLPLCLPAVESGNNDQIYLNFFNNSDAEGVSLTLQDEYGNDVFEINLNSNETQVSGWFQLELGPPSFEVIGTTVEPIIPEGESRKLRVNFNPVESGLVSDIISLNTNSPIDPQISIECNGVGISAISGEACNLLWTASNSPYFLTSDVTVPDSCYLEIEPGSSIDLNGYELAIAGELIAQGSEVSPIQIIGGAISFEEGLATTLSHVHFEDSQYENEPYVVLYYTDFESSSVEDDFYCEEPGQTIYSFDNSGDNGCSSFSRQSYWPYSNVVFDGSHNYSLYHNSYNSDGYFSLVEPLTAPYSGFYDVSFTYKSNGIYANCNYEIQFLDGENWTTAWESRSQTSHYENDQNLLARATKHFEAGDTIQFRIGGDVYNSSSNSNNASVYLDELRIERDRFRANEIGWSLQDLPIDQWQNSYAEDEVYLSGDTLHIRNHSFTNMDLNTSNFELPPIEISESGYYYVRYSSSILDADYRCYAYSKLRLNQSSTHTMERFYWNYNSSNVIVPFSDYESVYLIPQFLNVGDRIDFYFDINGYNSSERTFEADFWGFSVFRLDDSAQPYYDDWIVSKRSLNLQDCVGGAVAVTGNLSAENCDLGRIKVSGDSLYLDEFNSTGGVEGYNLFEATLINGSVTDAGTYGLLFDSSQVVLHIEELDIENSALGGIDLKQSDSATLTGLRVINSGTFGARVESAQGVNFEYALLDNNGGFGAINNSNAEIIFKNSRIANNGGIGLSSNGPVSIEYSNITFNEAIGLQLKSNNFSSLVSSILWGNDAVNYEQINIEGGVVSTSYTTVQGQSGYGVSGGGQFYWGEGVIEADPLFADDNLNLNTYSPCVDGGQPWLMDAHMPYGLGGVRADMGMYGGPDNAYWGGLALPDGASSLLTVQDSPQDQGNSVGLTFSSSFYDNSELVNNVTHYAFWRHFDPTGAPIANVAEGNWELLGEMPSLSLNNYAYQAPTLGNTNAFGDFSSCYFVAAHTADDDTYWISNVMCGESVDNLAPDDPDLNGLVLETGEAQISWTPPTEEDYAYTEIYNDDGFTAEVGNDTLVLDPSVIPGYTYTYTAVNYDVNGNASDASSLTLEIPAGLDIIPLTAGWNLISTDRSASTPAIEDVLSSLNEGNVEYVTGFNNGVVLYDPDGYFLFNTLDEFESGYGYWIKVQEDDTLEIAGSLLTDGYMPSLNMGWNLIGYPNAENSTVEAYFDQLLSDESLEYVTGFNQGSSYFDPNGLPFLNSLVQLENGFGYWLKVSQAYDFNGLVTDQVDEPLAALSGATGIAQPNPNYMLLNGTSNLAQEAGKQALVHALDGTVVGALPILEGGYLMTTALYGDDPATEALEGLQAGDEVYFSFEGKRSKEAVVYNGQMELRHINLEFEVQSLFEVFPNPFAESITISGVLEVGGMLDAVVTDSQGRVVAQRPAIEMTAGSYSLDWELPRLAPGYYNCTLRLEGVTLDSMPIMHVEQ